MPRPLRVLALAILVACSAPPPPFSEITFAPVADETRAPSPAADRQSVVLVGAGDIASCASDGSRATAALLDAIAGTVFTAGDNAYERGSPEEYARCYGPSWGRHRARTRPALGTHEYLTAGASGYFAYFGELAGDPRTGYYSYELGAWHIVVLNSNCGEVGGCGPGSPQIRWLEDDLARSPALCTVAIWHNPRFSSGIAHGSDPTFDAFWRVLWRNGVDVVINGHDHHYERFAPQTPDGKRDDARGIREFIVGTGGASLRRAGRPIANSEVVRDDTYGLLRLTMRADGYDWQFVPVAGATFSDSGSESCH